MNIVVEARHMEVTDAIRRYIESKAAKLSRYYDNIRSAEVVLGMEADQPMMEIIVQAGRKTAFVASARDEDMYACIDRCLHKVIEQLRRYKDRVRDHKGTPHGAAGPE